MIKNNKPLFHPTFGSRPANIVGRDQIISGFLDGLTQPVGSRDRCVFFIGQRGMGKTALLLELADRASEAGYVIANVTAYEGMADDIIESVQRNGAAFVEKKGKKLRGVSAGALEFSFGLTFSEEVSRQYGFRSKLTLLCDKLASRGKGVLILIDETISSEALRQVAITYQHLVGEEKNIALGMAGLPHAVSSVLNDKVLTFLNRATKCHLEPIRTQEIHAYFQKAFRQLKIDCPDALCLRAAESAKGFPYLMQLVGYYLTQFAGEKHAINERVLSTAVDAALHDMEENVFAPILKPLSENDIIFLKAMAEDETESKTANLCERMGKSNSWLQPYRSRLIDAGIIESPGKGRLVFAVPYLAEYLRKESSRV